MENLVEESSKIIHTTDFKESLSSIDKGILDPNPNKRNFRAQSEAPTAPLFSVPSDNKDQDVYDMIHSLAKGCNVLSNCLEYAIGQNLISGSLHGITNVDTQHINENVKRLYDNFSMWTRVTDKTFDAASWNGDLIENALKHQKDNFTNLNRRLDIVEDSFTNIGTRINVFESDVMPRFESLFDLVAETQNDIHGDTKGKSKAALVPPTPIVNQTSPIESSSSLDTIANSTSSLASQMASIQNSVSNMEKRLDKLSNTQQLYQIQQPSPPTH